MEMYDFCFVKFRRSCMKCRDKVSGDNGYLKSDQDYIIIKNMKYTLCIL